MIRLPRRSGAAMLLSVLVAACGGEGDGPATVDPAAVTTAPPLAEKVLVFALDGATWDLIDPLFEAGRLPNLAGLVRDGVRADLVTLEPTLSPAIWTTIATGVLPERHGILGFDGVPGYTTKTLPNTGMRQVKAFWNVLPGFGVDTGVVGWWVTWPAEPVPEGSYIVTDRVPYSRMEAAIHAEAVSVTDAYPSALLETVLPLVRKPDDIDPAVVERFLRMTREEMEERLLASEYTMGNALPEFKYVHQSDLSTVDIAVRLFGDRPVDLAVVYLTGIDTVSHLFWHYTFPEGFEGYRVPAGETERWKDVIPLYYELVDEYLGRLLAVMGEGTTTLVISDHGFGGTGNLPWSGGHGRITPGAPIAPPGVFVLSGPGARAGVTLERAHVLDVLPTLLRLFGVPAGEDMPGMVLEGALVADAPELARIPSLEEVGNPRLAETPPVDPEGDAERLERLRSLGYLGN